MIIYVFFSFLELYEIPSSFSICIGWCHIFDNFFILQKYKKDNKRNSFQLPRKYARICALGHYLFLEAHSNCQASLWELFASWNKWCKGTNGGYCLYSIKRRGSHFTLVIKKLPTVTKLKETHLRHPKIQSMTTNITPAAAPPIMK